MCIFALISCVEKSNSYPGCDVFNYTKSQDGMTVSIDAIIYYDDGPILLPISQCNMKFKKLAADFDFNQSKLDEMLFQSRGMSNEHKVYGVKSKIKGVFKILYSINRPDGLKYVEIIQTRNPQITRIDKEYRNSLIPLGE
jgi:hypothetical protein